MLITIWSGLADVDGERIDAPWERLGDVLSSLPEGALFSCAAFDGRRGKDAFAFASAIVLDHDAATVPLSRAAEALKRTRAMIYPTKTEGRWRAIVPLASPIIGYDAYLEAAKPLMNALQCARESGTGSQMWFPPRKGFRYLSPFDGETRLIAWINGDYVSGFVKGDIPKHEGTDIIDRSRVDAMISTRLVDLDVSKDEHHAIFKARNGLSHAVTPYYLDLLWSKATTHVAAERERGSWSPEAEIADAARVEITIDSDIHRAVDAAISALAADRKLFVRDAVIVEIVPDKRACAITKEISSASIQDRLSRVAQCVRYTKDGDIRHIHPPRELTEIVRDKGAYPQLRHLKGITEVPILRPDGSIHAEPGYDPVTQFYCAGAVEIDMSLSAVDGLRILREPFSEFPWVAPGMIDIPIALICAITCRAAIDGNVPLFVFDASEPGAGKGLIVETVSAIVNGLPSGTATFPPNDEELAKNIAAQARASRSLVSYDNVTRTIQGDALDSALTCNGSVSFRILAKTQIATTDWNAAIVINGNQLRIGGDTRRRTILARILRDRQKRDFKWTLPRDAQRQRQKLLSAAIAIVRGGILNGVPKLESRASFERFIPVVAGAIVAAGGHDITRYWREEETVTESDEAREAMTVWIALRWPNGATATQIVDDLGEAFMPSADAQAMLKAHGLDGRIKDALRWLAEARPGASKRQAMAWALHSWRDVYTVAQGARMRIVSDGGRNATWKVEVSNA